MFVSTASYSHTDVDIFHSNYHYLHAKEKCRSGISRFTRTEISFSRVHNTPDYYFGSKVAALFEKVSTFINVQTLRFPTNIENCALVQKR